MRQVPHRESLPPGRNQDHQTCQESQQQEMRKSLFKAVQHLLLHQFYIQFYMSDLSILPLVLTQIHKRYCAVFFSKLVLFYQDDSEKDSEQHNLRHYDLECEAVQTIASVLNTKINSIQFKCFFQIKDCRKNRTARLKRPFRHTLASPSGLTLPLNISPKATGFKSMTNTNMPSRYSNRERCNTFSPLTNDISFEDDDQISVLLSKVKTLKNRIEQKKRNRDREDPENDQLSLKMKKKKMILQKISHLKSNINQLMEESLQDYCPNHNFSYMSIELDNSIEYPHSSGFLWQGSESKITRNGK